MSFADLLLGDLSSWSTTSLMRAFRYGPPGLKIRVSQVVADQGDVQWCVKQASHPVPGVRRAAARGIGWARAVSGLPILRQRLRQEAMDTVRIAVGGALLRLGEDQELVEAGVLNGPATRMWTAYGEKNANRAIAQHEAHMRHQLHQEGLRIEASSRDEDKASFALWLNEKLPAGEVDALEAWAALGIANFIEHVEGKHPAGRRAQHRLLSLRGVHGCPSHRKRLRNALESLSDDPGLGFARRRIAAAALGLLGNPNALPTLIAAADRELRDFEGRPGSGLGVQFPVRNTLIWAIGEIGNPAAGPYLAEFLDDIDGTATGGLYLPAMSALAKLGVGAIPALQHGEQHSELRAVHAAWLLGRLSHSSANIRSLRDSRATVRAAYQHGAASVRSGSQH
jgi:hypothetical protein